MDVTFDVDSFFANSQEIKRDMDLPSDEQAKAMTAPQPKRKGTKRSQDQSEIDKRNVRRRENQKVACRNYRMRKKEYLSELKTKIQKLEAEKELLTKENLSHKNQGNLGVDPSVVACLNDVSRIMTELENALKNNVEDRVVEYLLQAFFLAAGKLHTASTKDIDDLVNPFTQVSLASLGYIPSMEFPEITATRVGGWWDSYVTTANLTQDQVSKLNDIINKLCKRDCELRMERGLIDKQIKQFYLHKLMVVPLMNITSQPIEQLDAKTVLDFTWLLNRLKSNILTQKSLLLTNQSAIGSVLSPRQHAFFVVNAFQSRIFEWPYHAQTLRNAWDLVSHSDAPASPASSPSSPSSYPSSPYYPSSPPQYMVNSSPSTVVPALAIPTPPQPFPQSFGYAPIAPNSPSLTPTCTPQSISGNPQHTGLVQSFLSSLNYGVH